MVKPKTAIAKNACVIHTIKYMNDLWLYSLLLFRVEREKGREHWIHSRFERGPKRFETRRHFAMFEQNTLLGTFIHTNLMPAINTRRH